MHNHVCAVKYYARRRQYILLPAIRFGGCWNLFSQTNCSAFYCTGWGRLLFIAQAGGDCFFMVPKKAQGKDFLLFAQRQKMPNTLRACLYGLEMLWISPIMKRVYFVKIIFTFITLIYSNKPSTNPSFPSVHSRKALRQSNKECCSRTAAGWKWYRKSRFCLFL